MRVPGAPVLTAMGVCRACEAPGNLRDSWRLLDDPDALLRPRKFPAQPFQKGEDSDSESVPRAGTDLRSAFRREHQWTIRTQFRCGQVRLSLKASDAPYGT